MDEGGLTGIPPLRGAVLRLLREPCGFDLASLEGEAGVARDRALAYASILLKQGALAIAGGYYIRGHLFDEWSTAVCRSRPRGGSASQERMDAIFENVSAGVRRRREERGWSVRELARRCGLHAEVVRRLETRHRRNVPFPALMLMAQALDTTVELLATKC